MSDEGLETLPGIQRIDPYRQWLEHEGVRVVEGLYCPDIGGVELGPWPRKGCAGAVLNFDGFKANSMGNDIHVVEIAPGSASEPERHMYEELVYVYSGRGASTIWIDENAKQTFEWHAGSLFAIPLNGYFQHFNGSGTEPARLMSVTTAAQTLRHFHFNEEFLYDCPVAFKDRFGSDNYFSAEGVMWRSRNNHVWESNFVPDARNMKLYQWKERGGGGRNIMLQMGEGNLIAHISSFQVGTYKKAHRHGSGAYLYILGGDGFSLVWQDDNNRIKADWHEGSVFAAGAGGGEWFHQHFNAGREPARYLALRGGQSGSFKYGNTTGGGWNRAADLSIKEGGMQVEYPDEDPEVHRIFEEELAKYGATCRMKNLSPYCTGEVGPTTLGEWGDD